MLHGLGHIHLMEDQYLGWEAQGRRFGSGHESSLLLACQALCELEEVSWE